MENVSRKTTQRVLRPDLRRRAGSARFFSARMARSRRFQAASREACQRAGLWRPLVGEGRGASSQRLLRAEKPQQCWHLDFSPARKQRSTCHKAFSAWRNDRRPCQRPSPHGEGATSKIFRLLRTEKPLKNYLEAFSARRSHRSERFLDSLSGIGENASVSFNLFAKTGRSRANSAPCKLEGSRISGGHSDIGGTRRFPRQVDP